MRRRAFKGLICLTLVSAVLLSLTGCTAWPLWLLGDTAVSFTAGWLARGQSGTTETSTCYRNGELVDCDSLPSSLLP